MLLKLRVRPEQTDAVRGYVVRTGGRVLDPARGRIHRRAHRERGGDQRLHRGAFPQAELIEVVRSGALGIGRNARPLRVVR